MVRNSTNHGEVSIGDELWVATALLHREHPDQQDFTRHQIEDRIRRENIAGRFRPGVTPHIYLHAVANRPPKPGKLRMLFATSDDRRRLFRDGDPYDPARQGPTDHGGSRVAPDANQLPPRYRELLDWYFSAYSPRTVGPPVGDPILTLRGLGKAIWDEQPDEYVERLRAGWA
jgi:hypothetical protein